MNTTNTIKTLFLGSNWEAQATFKVLVDDPRFEMIGLITQPDKPVGRKQEILPIEIKQYAQSKSIPVFHTEGNPELYKKAVELFNPELVVCKSFGEIVPGFFLDAPKYKSINIHYSVLPKYRGAVPIQKAILEGDSETGFTIVQMVEKLDSGPVLHIEREIIKPDDTNQSLRERLVKKTGEILPDILMRWVNGDIKVSEQDESQATYCWKNDISKENAQINFELDSAEQIDRMVRALIPWPVAWFELQGTKNSRIQGSKRVKIFRASVFQGVSFMPGTIKDQDGKLLLGTKDSDKCIEIHELQLEGKNQTDAKSFIQGNQQLLS